MTGEVEWRVTPGLTEYPAAVTAMTARAAAIRAGDAAELVWLVEHPPLYTAGTSARPAELLDTRLPVFASGRGGRYTYHGPGQRVVYVMLDLAPRGRDIRRYIGVLEAWIVAALGDLGIAAFTIPGRVGVWTGPVADPGKVAAIGVRVSRWVTMHGAAINVAPNLDHFGGIVPCGIDDARVTSLAALGRPSALATIDAALLRTLPKLLAGIAVQLDAMSLEKREEVG